MSEHKEETKEFYEQHKDEPKLGIECSVVPGKRYRCSINVFNYKADVLSILPRKKVCI